MTTHNYEKLTTRMAILMPVGLVVNYCGCVVGMRIVVFIGF